MKTTYTKPQVWVHNVHTETSLLAGSETMGINKDTDATKNSDGTYGLSRRSGSLWDDDEE